jgi:hypothetical protein
VSAVLEETNNREGCESTNGSTDEKKRRPTIGTHTNIEKVKDYASLKNPLSQPDVAQRVGIYGASIYTIIYRDLDMHKRMEPKVHHLTERAIAQHVKQTLQFHDLVNSS